MSLKVVPPKDLEKLDRTIKILKELIKVDIRETDKNIHKQDLEYLIKHRKSLNIKK